MRKLLSMLLIILCITHTYSVAMATCEGESIFYANGMNNSRKMALDGLRYLEKKTRPTLPASAKTTFHLAYNQKEDFIEQLVEVISQKGFEEWRSFWSALAGESQVPDILQQASLRELWKPPTELSMTPRQ